MSFDTNYPNRKDWRKPLRKSKAFDRSCRNHGSCDWCKSNRTYSARKWAWLSDQEIKEWRSAETFSYVDNPFDVEYDKEVYESIYWTI